MKPASNSRRFTFPEYKTEPRGHGEYRVGLHKFMEHLNAAMPVWLSYST
jgi:hypothetical protein